MFRLVYLKAIEWAGGIYSGVLRCRVGHYDVCGLGCGAVDLGVFGLDLGDGTWGWFCHFGWDVCCARVEGALMWGCRIYV